MSNQLLVPLDGSALADAAIPQAVEIARRTGAEIILTRVHTPAAIMPYPPELPIMMVQPDWDEGVRKEAKAWLLKRAADLARTTSLRVLSVFGVGRPAEEIVSLAARRRARAIVCSTHGVGGLAPHWLGSVADALVRHAKCPVLALPPDAPARSDGLRRLLVLLDGSEVSQAILPEASWLAKAFHAEVELLSVVSSSWIESTLAGLEAGEPDRFGIGADAARMKALLDRTAAELRGQNLRVRSTVEISAHPARTILEHIEHTNPDAVALATYGRGLSRLFLGSTADKVLRSSGRPTLLMRPRARLTAKGGSVRHKARVEAMAGAASGA
jgi:nucleotide-binding universal stress UspA family protein